MSQRKALKIVGILLSVSLLVLLVNGALIRFFPEKFDRNLKEPEQETQDKNETVPADQLPLNQMLATETTKNNQNIYSWPYDSSVPIYHQANLEIYKDRLKDENALKGITVYLSVTNLIDRPEQTTDSPASQAETTSEVYSEDPVYLGDQYTDRDYQSILDNVLSETQKSLEAIGAKVIRVNDHSGDDVQKAAFIGEDILNDFKKELLEQNFESKILEGLQTPLAGIKNSSSNQEFFADVGVTREHRLLLDVERQYSDRLFINLSFGESENGETGSLIRYFANQSAAIGAQGDEITLDMAEKPAYIAYDAENRQRLAKLTSKNINQLLPVLISDVEAGIKEDIVPSLRLLNLTNMDIELGKKDQVYDMQILTSAEQQRVLAEAISNACFEFYCTNLD